MLDWMRLYGTFAGFSILRLTGLALSSDRR